MDCTDAELLLARDRGLSDAEASALDEHVASCDSCAELLVAQAHQGKSWLALPPVDPATFEICEEIASGGMGRIFRAIDRRLGREVAVKEVISQDQRARFEREATITARLQHPAIVPIYEAGIWPSGRAFYTMRLVPGGTLGDAIAKAQTLSARLALLPHVIAATEAVAYAHAHGIIHRDLKPQNILVGEFGETVVIDWGLAKATGELFMPDDDGTLIVTPELTQVGSVVGTPCFLSPEQARGEDLDERADVFALGAVLYNLVAGEPPYWDRARDVKQMIAAVLAGPPAPLSSDVPADVRVIIERALAREPAQRYPDARMLADELRRFQGGQLLVSRAYRSSDLLARWLRKHRAIVASVAVASVALGVVGTVALVKVTRARDAERAQRTIAETAFDIGERRGQRKLCEASVPALATPWTDAAANLVQRKFTSLGLPYAQQTFEHVNAGFTRWTTDLVATREALCDATDQTRPRKELAAVLDCLTDRVREGRALVGLFTEADQATVLAAATATEQLRPSADCTKPASIRPPELATAQTGEVRASFAKTHALMELGKYTAALPLAREGVVAADATRDVPLRAAARIALGAALIGTSDLVGAALPLGEAVQLAESASDDRAAALAWVNLLHIAYLRGRHDEVSLLSAPALGAAERVGDVWVQTEMMMYVGGSLTQQGKFDEAQRIFEQAVALRRKLYGERDRRLAFALSALGNAYAMRGKLAEGIAAHASAAQSAEAALGSAHPQVGVMYGNLASDYLYGLRFADAIREDEKYLAAVEGAYGPKHRDVANALSELGAARYEAGDLEHARSDLERAERIWRDVSPKHPALANVLLYKYLAARDLGQHADPADLAAALALAGGLPPFMRARIQLELAKVTPGPAGTALAKASLDGFSTSTLPLVERDHAAATAWLAKR